MARNFTTILILIRRAVRTGKRRKKGKCRRLLDACLNSNACGACIPFLEAIAPPLSRKLRHRPFLLHLMA
jgi:hypothetical protein